MISSPAPDALLVALVLCPGAYSRNRFFSLYQNPEAFEARRRAALVRSIVAELAHADPQRRGRVVSIEDDGASGNGLITYIVPSIGLRRSTLLSTLELSIVRYAVARRMGSTEGLDTDEATRLRIENALRGLSPEIADSARSAFEEALFDGADDEIDEFVLTDAPGEG